MKAGSMSRIVNRRRYDTSRATMVASDAYWDGHNWERSGRNTWLYRTPNGAFFIVRRTWWQGENDTLEPVTAEEAERLYTIGGLREHELQFAQAFPLAAAKVIDA